MTGDASEPDMRGVEDLRLAIAELHGQLDALGPPPSPVAEVVDSTNLLRTNVYLSAKDEASSNLLSCYMRYVRALESMMSGILEVQSEVIGVLKAYSARLDEDKGGRRTGRKAVGRPPGSRNRATNVVADSGGRGTTKKRSSPAAKKNAAGRTTARKTARAKRP